MAEKCNNSCDQHVCGLLVNPLATFSNHVGKCHESVLSFSKASIDMSIGTIELIEKNILMPGARLAISFSVVTKTNARTH